jgi:hypothetical protein
MITSGPEPRPGDFDRELREVDAGDVQVEQASRGRRLIVQFNLDGDDAAALQRIADVRGERPAEVVSWLIREASAKTS